MRKVIAQNNRCRQMVLRRFRGFFLSSANASARLLRVPRSKPLVMKLDGHSQMLLYARRKCASFLRHLALCAIEVQWQTDNQQRYFVFAHDLPQTAEIVGAIFSSQYCERSRSRAAFVGNCQADAFAAVIQRKNPAAARGRHTTQL